MKKCIFLVFCLSLTAGIASGQDIYHLESLRFLDFNPQVTNKWLYSLDDRPEYKSRSFDDSAWLSAVPGEKIADANTSVKDSRIYWIRSHFTVAEELKGVNILINLESLDPFECYMNGRLIFSRSNVDGDYQTVESEFPLITVRDRDLNYGSRNILAIRVLNRPGAPVILPQANCFRINGLLYHPSIPSFMHSENFAMISILFSVIFFTLWVFRRKDYSSLFFAFANLCFAYYFHRMTVPPAILPYNLSFNFSKACLLFAVSLLVVFLRFYFGKSLRKGSLFTLTAAIAAAGTVMTLFPKSIAEAEALFNFLILIPSFLGIIYIGVLAYSGINEKQPTASIVFVGAVLAVAMGMHDMLYAFLKLTPRFWLQGFSIIFFDFSIFISLIFHIMQIFKDLEDYTRKVEEAVQDRTQELNTLNIHLEKALKDAKDANRAKSDFLANVSHEIRTPLNCIVGFAEIIAEQNVNTSIGEYSDLIVQESAKLQHLIDEILDISKIESGKIETVSEEFGLRELIESVYRSFYSAASEKNLDFSYSVDEQLPNAFLGDGFRLRQVLMNLVSNAVKFTHEGSIVITVSYISSIPMQVRFEVADTGIGIKESRKKDIFESFVQADSSTVRKYGGTGLGTTISKRLIELMGGTIGFSSEEGQGTTFYFSLPLNPAAGIKAELNTVESGSDIRLDGNVLLVEDYPPNRLLVESMLKDTGLSWDVATNGLEALSLFEGRRYSAILMDIQMPEMDGCEATRRIRAMERKKRLPQVPIIGFTANAFPDEVTRYIDLGMNGVITKPVRRQDFLSKLTRVLSGSALDAVTADQPARTNHVFDYQGLLTELGWDSEISKKLVGDFLDILEKQVEELKSAIASGDFENAHRAFHSIRGGAANVYAETLSLKAQRLEAYLKNGLNGGKASGKVPPELNVLFDEFLTAYEEFRQSARVAIS